LALYPRVKGTASSRLLQRVWPRIIIGVLAVLEVVTCICRLFLSGGTSKFSVLGNEIKVAKLIKIDT